MKTFDFRPRPVWEVWPDRRALAVQARRQRWLKFGIIIFAVLATRWPLLALGSVACACLDLVLYPIDP